MDSIPPPGMPAPAQLKTSAQAVWSLVLGILSIPCLWIFGSVPAIILGILAIKKIDRAPEQLQGKGLAIAGIITGGVGVVSGIFMMAAMAMPAYMQISENAKLTRQSSDVRQLILACRTYAADENGKFPPDLDVLVQEGYLDTEELLGTQDSGSVERVPYLYRPGLVDNGTETPLIIGPLSPNGKRVVGFANGMVRALREAEVDKIIELEKFEQ